MISRSNPNIREKESFLSLYEELGKACYEIRKAERNEAGKPYPQYEHSHDVGSGDNPRFSTSATEVFTNQEVQAATKKLMELCHVMSIRMADTNNDIQKLQVAQQFASDCQSAMVGIGPLKGQMMVQLCALFGIVPLDFYTFLPIHLKGGPGVFMKEMMNWEKSHSKCLLQWNVDIVSKLQQIYNKEVTYNLFENGGCEIGRKNTPNDLYFLIPNATKEKQGRIKFTFNTSRLQFFFRVDGNRSNDWRVQMFAGGSNKIILFCDKKNKLEPVLEWPRAKSNGMISTSSKLNVNWRSLTKLDKVCS